MFVLLGVFFKFDIQLTQIKTILWSKCLFLKIVFYMFYTGLLGHETFLDLTDNLNMHVIKFWQQNKLKQISYKIALPSNFNVYGNE